MSNHDQTQQPRQQLPYITNYQEYNGHASIKIKSEQHDTKDALKAPTNNLNASTTNLPTTDHMSCVYKSESPTSKTILITTNNYSQSRCSDGTIRTDTPSHIKNNSSITIFTHNPPADSPASNNVNILINNHFNEAPPPPPQTTQSDGVKVELAKPFTHIHIPAPIPIHLQSGDEVFVRLKDDRFHLANIVTTTAAQCLVRFPDKSECWSDRVDVQRLSAQDVLPTCIVCKSSNAPETIAKCRKCGRAFHLKCVGATADGVWFCRRGHRNVNGDAGDVLANGVVGETNDQRMMSVVEEVKRTGNLPYHLKSLTWDKAHRQNNEQIYCYCGNNGEWFMQMLQCAHCQQWFHEKCIDLQYPLYCGDGFYVFVCAVCNNGNEFVRRLQLKLDDLVHLLLYNLSVHNERRYFDLTKVIVPYAIDNWHALQLLPTMKSMSFAEIKDRITKTLQTHVNRFKCRTSTSTPNTASNQYCLRNRNTPPMAPSFEPLVWPADGSSVTEKVVREYLRDKAKILPRSTTCDVGACGDEMRYTMTGKAYFKLPTITSQPKGCIALDNDDQFTSEDDDEILANLAVGKKSSDISSTTSSISCLPPTPPTSESRPLTPTGSTTVDSDIYEYCSAKEDSPVVVQLRPKLLLTQHKRKRGRPFGSVKTAAKLLAAQTQLQQFPNRKTQYDYSLPDRAPSSFSYSSDDNSSRGTLDLIIPPPKDFQGINNPFLSQICEPQQPDHHQTTKVGAKTKKSGGGAFGTSQIRLVRTVKRRLSARDIVIGPNMEVKRRKVRRSSGHFEVISTSTIVQTIIGGPSPKPYTPIRTDFKDLALTAPTNTATSTGLSPPPPPPPPSQPILRPEEAYGIGGRRLRKRGDTNYSDNPKRHSGNLATLPGSASGSSSPHIPGGTTLNQIPGGAAVSPVKNGSDVSLTELQSSLTMYFGAANRIANGERFSIQGRRVGLDGRNQFLIEWDTTA